MLEPEEWVWMAYTRLPLDNLMVFMSKAPQAMLA
jgi:hypothetical protein